MRKYVGGKSFIFFSTDIDLNYNKRAQRALERSPETKGF